MSENTPNQYVALLVETSSVYGRNLLKGILKFVRSHQESNWVTLLDQQGLFTNFSSLPTTIPISGLISRSRSPAVVDWVRSLNVPRINLDDSQADNSTSFQAVRIRSADEKIGKLAGEHLVSLGFKNFGFAGYTKEAWSTRRCKGFRASIARLKSYTIQLYHSPNFLNYIQNFETEQEQIVNWLNELPKPVGVMACNDLRGKQILDCCLQAGIRVPDEVAVIGVDNDELLTNFCNPPMSSVVPNAEKTGFLAAVMLDDLLNQKTVEHELIEVDPLEIHIRQSTDIVAVADPDISEALKFMRDNAFNGISVNDIVQNLRISRSTLERKLKELIGRTPQQELRRIQLNNVRKLLLTSNYSIEEVAVRSGFGNVEHFHVIFKSEFGITPGEFRNQHRVG